MSRAPISDIHDAAADLAAVLGAIDSLMGKVVLIDAHAEGDRSLPAAIPILIEDARRRAEAVVDQFDDLSRPEK